MRYCLSLEADTSLRDKDGLGCLHATIGTAKVNRNTPEICNILNLLLDHKVDPNIQTTSQGFTPLHLAANTSNFDAIKTLLERDKDMINATDEVGKTPLWYACLDTSPNLNMIKYLARKGGRFVDQQWPELSGSRRETINSILQKEFDERNSQVEN